MIAIISDNSIVAKWLQLFQNTEVWPMVAIISDYILLVLFFISQRCTIVVGFKIVKNQKVNLCFKNDWSE